MRAVARGGSSRILHKKLQPDDSVMRRSCDRVSSRVAKVDCRLECLGGSRTRRAIVAASSRPVQRDACAIDWLGASTDGGFGIADTRPMIVAVMKQKMIVVEMTSMTCIDCPPFAECSPCVMF